jgi:hypothetical protein
VEGVVSILPPGLPAQTLSLGKLFLPMNKFFLHLITICPLGFLYAQTSSLTVRGNLMQASSVSTSLVTVNTGLTATTWKRGTKMLELVWAKSFL